MKLETILNALILVSQLSLSDKSARQYDAFRDRILRMDAEKDALLLAAAEWAYQGDVVDTQMVSSLIGGDNEYADKEDWIESWLRGLRMWTEEDKNV